jgi:NAD(P)-dependent dehydrogenase (short-subunit alcohol dehydrogenase family)
VVLITGASSGLGKSSAELLSAKGMRVFGTSRKTKGERVDGYDLLPLDVDSDSSVDRCVKSVMEKTDRLDVLVNNAGQFPLGAIEETTIVEARSVFETNFFGAVRMVNAVLPMMKKQKEGLIINISSVAAMIAAPTRAYYSASKAALGSYSDVLRYEVRRFGIHVCAVYPGFFNTGGEERTLLPSVPLDEYKQMRNNVITIRANDLQNGDSPKLLAETILHIIRTKSPKARYVVGKGSYMVGMQSILPRSTFESLIEGHYKLNG